jgi:DNA-binding response OmpR family regulator
LPDGIEAAFPETPVSIARILIVDDEPAVLKFMATVLRKSGYEVYSAQDASAAIQQAKQLSCGLNVLITDLLMPEKRGDELVREMRQICPYLDVLAVTGALAETNQGIVNCRVLQKPFSPRVLLATVKEILQGQIF